MPVGEKTKTAAKDAGVRVGTLHDLGLFRDLWAEYMQDQWDKGGEMIADGRNVEVFLRIAQMYMGNTRRGVVLFAAEDNAVLMWGDQGNPVRTRGGDMASGWGTYVRKPHRGKGVASQLREVAKIAMKGFGFAWVQGTGLNENKEGLASGVKDGFVLYANLGRLDIEPPEND